MKTFRNITLIILAISFVVFSCKKDDTEEEPCNGVSSVDIGADFTLSYGDTSVLDAGNPGASFLWSTGETSQKITIDTLGIYWVKVEKCESSVSDTIIIDMIYPTIKVETGFGDFRIWLYAQTVLHRQNMISLAEQHFYDSLTFHRIIYDFVVQGGDPQGDGFGGPGYTLPAEIIPGLHHVYGAVGAARQSDYYNPDRDSNGSQFYIVSDPDGEEDILDDKYSVFGFVFSGMDAVFEMSQVEVDTNSMPLETVFMNTIRVEEFSAQQLEEDFNFIIP